MTQSELWFRFIMSVLVVWRVTHLLNSEDGPGDIFYRLRGKLGDAFAGKLLDCFYCLSLWVAAPAALAVGRNTSDWAFAWMALSGAACLLERATETRKREEICRVADSEEKVSKQSRVAEFRVAVLRPSGRELRAGRITRRFKQRHFMRQ